MAAQNHPASVPPRLRLAACEALRVAVFSAASLAGVALVGCADAVTFSRSETSTGRTLLAEGESEEASIIFANQVRRNPKDYEAHYHLGQARLSGGRPEEAIRSFKTALEVMPLTHEGRSDDAIRFAIIDALSGALAEHDPDGSQLAQIEQKAKGDGSLKLLIAMTYAKSGHPDSAIQSFNEAIALDRDDPQVSKQFGLYLESIAQDDHALKQLRRAYRLNTQDEEVAAALLRLGVVPGPAILSATELSKPIVPLGPIPEVKWGEKQAQTPNREATPQATPPTEPPPSARRGLN
jgi:tetratricopeptide (TPR) repeat protein